MANLLGKRAKRKYVEQDNELDGEADDEAWPLRTQERLRSHFQSKFEPLPDDINIIVNHVENELEASEADETEWEGISEDESSSAVIIHHADPAHNASTLTAKELRSFMTSRPPGPEETGVVDKADQAEKDADEATEAMNVKNDLALQRLLKESHLLDGQTSLSHHGATRHKALDLRLQELGGKQSIYNQQKMPLAQRRGILAKATEREDKRRREAQENGIILEKQTKKPKSNPSKRQRGIGGPSVGSFQGGTLTLSRKDVARIQGPKQSRGRT